MYIFGIILVITWLFVLYLYFDGKKKANRKPKMISFKQYTGEHPSLKGLDADKDILYCGPNAFEARKILDKHSLLGSALIIDNDVISYNLVYTETFNTRNFKQTFTVEKVDIYKGKNFRQSKFEDAKRAFKDYEEEMIDNENE